MQRNPAIPSLSSTVKYLYQRLLSKQRTGFSGHHTGRSETDDLLERMSVRELGDLPLGPEPRFVDSGGSPLLDAEGPREERSADLSGSHMSDAAGLTCPDRRHSTPQTGSPDDHTAPSIVGANPP
jgi:hypothetical protein